MSYYYNFINSLYIKIEKYQKYSKIQNSQKHPIQKQKMFNSITKSKVNTANEQTGTEFYNHNHSPQQDDQSFTYEIEIEKQYVQRLKMQREKIQTLYSKYDVLLNDMKRKDTQIHEQQSKIKVMDTTVKNLQLNCQQMSLIKQQNKQLMNENMSLKHRIIALQNENMQMLEQMKLKQCLVTDEKDELQQINEQLQEKLKSLNNKLILSQQEFKANLDVEKQKLETSRNESLLHTTQLTGEVNTLRNQLIRKDQNIHIMRMDNQFLQQKMSDQQQTYSVYLKDLQFKIEKNQKQKRLQIKALKDCIEQKNCEISVLESKLLSVTKQLQTKDLQLEDAKRILREEKKMFDEDTFQLKSQMTNEKNYFRQQFMYCQNHIEKIEKKLADSLRRQKDLNQKIRRLESNDAAKRNLRQIEKQQLQKINKILSFQ